MVRQMALLAAVLFMPATLLTAQGTTPPRGQIDTPNSQRQNNAMAMDPMTTDQKIAHMLLISNRDEVELCKFIQDKVNNPQVKDFANRMVTEHQQCVQKLQQFTGGAAHQEGNLNSNADAFNRSGNARNPENTAVLVEDDGRSREGKMVHRHMDYIKVKRAVSDKVLSAFKEDLEQMSPEEVAMAFLGQQKLAHVAMVAFLEEVKPYASNDMQEMLDRELEKVRNHKQSLKQLCDQVKPQLKNRNQS